MKKPMNLVALSFWIVAAAMVVVEAPMALMLWSFVKNTDAMTNHAVPDYAVLPGVWRDARQTLLVVAQIIGIGVVIEIVDQIRWNAMPVEKQIPKHALRDAMGRFGAAIRRLRAAG